MYDIWKCTFGDLIRYCAKRPTLFLPEEATLVLKEVLKTQMCWYKDKRPTPFLIRLVRQMVKAVEELHLYQILHGSISVDSFFVEIHEHKISLSLGNLTVCGLKDQISFDEDIQSLGVAVGFALTEGGNVYTAAGNYNSLGVLTCEANSLVQNLVQMSITAEKARYHPFFWSKVKKAKFFIVAHTILYPGPHPQSVETDLDDTAKTLSSTMNWFVKLPRPLRVILANDNPQNYKFNVLIDLLRFVRNKLVHCAENTGTFERIMGDIEETVVDFFIGIYPDLLGRLYVILSRHFSINLSFKSDFLQGQ